MSHQWLPDEISQTPFMLSSNSQGKSPDDWVAGPENTRFRWELKDGGFPEGCLQVRGDGMDAKSDK